VKEAGKSIAAALLFLVPAVAASSAAAAGKFDACSLLTSAEIRAVQHEPVASTKSAEPQRNRFSVSQCFYTLPTFAKSISLEVTRRRPGETRGPRDDWKQLFGAPSGNESDREREERSGNGDEEKASPPRRISGVGDAAYWVGPAIVGGLYVLTGDAYIRLSVGGPDPEAVKIRKLTKLARRAIKRL
jgi:hypothetical protein